MDKIRTIESTAVFVPVDNIDTDQIIPARFLKTTVREGFGEKLFYDWRFNPDGSPARDNPLESQKGVILVAGNNFGCGSSREHAAWALHDAGFKAVVSSSFADIFRNNALNNCLLPVKVSEAYLERLSEVLKTAPDTVLKIDLGAQTISAAGAGEEKFGINGYKKECLMKGYSDIDYLLSDRKAILEYEASVERREKNARD